MRGFVISMAFGLLSIGKTIAFQSPYQRKETECTVKSVRKAWQDLTSAEKQSYIEGDLCLMSLPPKTGLPGAESRWDELQYAHAAQARYIHGTGAFLPFHRYFVTVHDHLLRAECNYTGPLPYWDEPADVGHIKDSPLFNGEPNFGGNGTGINSCVTSGPFANTTLRMQHDLTTAEYCLSRSLDDRMLNAAANSIVGACLQQDGFLGVWHCLEQSPHGAGHGGIGGTMIDVQLSPGDPIFWLHHGYLDAVWWKWQTLNLTSRLTEIAGNNTPSDISGPGGGFGGFNFTNPGFPAPGNGTIPGNGSFPGFTPQPANPAIENYFNDDGYQVTLNHTLWSANIVENVTIADVLDPRTGFVCGEFL
ncbi:Di-copper centre-containing protein [Xylariaceae sp. FL1272]|nr:Di-copper centre-containing protein [Xylariaceae sp. FL1272]